MGFTSRLLNTCTSRLTIADAATPAAQGFFFGDPLVLGNLESSASRDEISGIAAARNTNNLGSYFAIDDAATDTIFVLGPNLEDRGNITLTGAAFVDCEAIFTCVIDSTNYIFVCGIGDNTATRTNKQLFIIEEPDITDGLITIPNDGSWEEVTLQWPNTFAGPTDMGDVEAAFPADNNIYFITKREAQTAIRLFSLPLQATYSGTQTATDEGTITEIPDATGGPPTPGNVTDACISHDGQYVAVYTYDGGYGFEYDTDIPTTLNGTADTLPHPGLGSFPNSAPQLEASTFTHDDGGIVLVSETGAGAVANNFPGWICYRSNVSDINTMSVQEGVNSYAAGADTYIWEGANETVNYSTETTFVVDTNASDERWGLLRFSDLDTFLPENITIIGASLQMNIAVEGVETFIYNINTASKAWVEGTVTWSNLGGITIGTDTPSDPIGYAGGLAGRTGDIEFAIDPSVVQGWYDDDDDNYGLVFRCTDTNGLQYTSKEGVQADRPILHIQYNPDPNIGTMEFQQGLDSYTGAEDTYFWEDGAGAGTDYSAAVSLVSDKNPADERFTYLKWANLSTEIPAGATITAVEFDFFVNTEGAGFDIFESLKVIDPTDSWNDISGAGNNLLRNDIDCASVAAANWPGDVGQTGAYTVTTTAAFVTLVQKWYDNEVDNKGVILVATDSANGQQIDSAEGATQAQRPLLRVTYSLA